MFYAILFGVPVLNLLWWWRADARLRRLSLARSGRWRLLLGAFVLVQLALYGWTIFSRMADPRWEMPVVLMAAAYLWHLIVLPFTMLALGLSGGARLLAWMAGQAARGLRAGRVRETERVSGGTSGMETAESLPEAGIAPGIAWSAAAVAVPVAAVEVSSAQAPPRVSPAPALSRRQFLTTAAAVAAPPLITGTGVARALTQLDDFRIRRMEVPLAALPRELDGLTIAHITDVHVGRYTHGPVLKKIAERTNDLRADLIVLTGDLIDHDLDDLPDALDMIRRLDPAAGLFMCEGNHDLFESRETFETTVRRAGIPLLLNEAESVRVRGRDVQVLGLKWGRAGTGRAARRDAAFASHLEETLVHRDPEAFPILLAHHPHAFDPAAAAGLPLTLAGHTHGGQLMLTERVGLGQLGFKYWTGLYRQGDSALVVSNGVGNWFPLRVNAPAEIVHLTLRSMA